MDILSILSITVSSPIVMNNILDMSIVNASSGLIIASKSSKISSRTVRLIRMIRIVQMFRISKVYKSTFVHIHSEINKL